MIGFNKETLRKISTMVLLATALILTGCGGSGGSDGDEDGAKGGNETEGEELWYSFHDSMEVDSFFGG